MSRSFSTEHRKTKRISSHFKSIYPIILFEDPASISAIDKEAEVIDISETGMGLFTNTPLKVGHCLKFKHQRHWKLPKAAVVIWSLKHNNGYRAGIRFTD